MDFEQANPVIVTSSPFYPYTVTTASALPYWTVTIGGVQQSQITENDPSTGAPWVMLAAQGDAFGFTPIDGNYSVLLQGSCGTQVPELSQTGLIPASAQSLLFEAQAGGGSLNIAVGSQVVPFTAIGSGANYIVYGANISAWAGQTEELTFSTPQDINGPNNWLIDDISFSTEAVPEPGTLSLIAAGALTLAARRWHAKGL